MQSSGRTETRITSNGFGRIESDRKFQAPKEVKSATFVVVLRRW